MSSVVPAKFQGASHIVSQPFLLNDGASFWIVEHGSLDVFRVRSENGEPGGVRYHVIHLEAGEAGFGLDAADVPGFLLLAVPAPETQVRRVSATADLLADGEMRLAVAGWLNRWVIGLSESAISGAVPKLIEPLVAGEDVWVKPPRVAVAREAVAWTRHLEGGSHFLGIPEIPGVGGDVPFPVTRQSWLAPSTKSKLQPLSTAKAIEDGAVWGGLRVFHIAAMHAISLRVRAIEVKEAQRLKRKADGEQRLLQSSAHRMISILNENAEPPSESTGEDPIFEACKKIGAYLGITIQQHPDARRGIASRDPVRDISRASGIRFRKVVLRDAWWTMDHGPLLAMRQESKAPLALIPRGPNAYKAFDPVTGKSTTVNAELAAQLEPFVFTFYRPFPLKPITGKDLLQLSLRWGAKDISLLLVMGLASGLLSLATPIFTGILFDRVIPAADRSQLMQLGIILMVGAVSNVSFQVVRSIAALRLEGKIGASLQAAVWDRVLGLPASFFHDFAAGDLAMRAMSIDTIRRMLTGTAVNAVLNGIFSTFNLALLFYYSWKLALVGMGLILVAVLCTGLAGVLQMKQMRNIIEISGKLSGMVVGLISGIAKFRVSGTEPRAFAQWARLFADERALTRKARHVGDWLEVFNSAFPILSMLALYYAFTYLGATLKVTTGDFLAFNSAYGQFESAIISLSLAYIQVLGIVPTFERAKPILEALPESNEARSDPGELQGRVEATNISFRYKPDGPLILNQVSFHAEPGEFVAIVGPSGSGKSTLFRILMGFEEPESGTVYYDGLDIKGLDLQALRRQMGVVLQNGTLLTGDIFMNIVGSKQLTLEDATEAAKMAGLDEDIKRMPMGMHTMVSEGGGGLSGGQRQRLMIARAIVSRPRLLLFDEATSALDNRTQSIVTESLARLRASRIVIAHRLSTIIHADRIVVLKDGQVVQMGTYSQLIEQEGLFQELAKRQMA